MGKKRKKHKPEWITVGDFEDKALEKPLKIKLKVGGSEVTELSGSGHDFDDRSDHERERHKEKKKKKKKKSEKDKDKYVDEEERRRRKRKLEMFKEDLQEDGVHFPAVQEQVQGQRDVSSFVDFIDKLIDSFSIGPQLTMFIQNPFLITDVRSFSKEATQHFKWVNARDLQMELVDLQANLAMKELSARTNPSSFWLQMVPETAFSRLKKVALYILTMFGSTTTVRQRSPQ